MMGANYFVCSDCIAILEAEADEHKLDDGDVEESEFTMRKLRSAVNIISFECIAE